MTIILFSFSLIAFSQTIIEERIDEFTGDTIVRTSWETLHAGFDFASYFRVTWINSDFYFELKLMVAGGKVFSINKNDEIILKFNDGSIMKINAMKYGITSIGAGARGLSGSNAMGLEMNYFLQNRNIKILDKKLIEKMRIYLTDSYIECKLSKRNSKKIQNAVKMLE